MSRRLYPHCSTRRFAKDGTSSKSAYASLVQNSSASKNKYKKAASARANAKSQADGSNSNSVRQKAAANQRMHSKIAQQPARYDEVDSPSLPGGARTELGSMPDDEETSRLPSPPIDQGTSYAMSLAPNTEPKPMTLRRAFCEQDPTQPSADTANVYRLATCRMRTPSHRPSLAADLSSTGLTSADRDKMGMCKRCCANSPDTTQMTRAWRRSEQGCDGGLQNRSLQIQYQKTVQAANRSHRPVILTIS